MRLKIEGVSVTITEPETLVSNAVNKYSVAFDFSKEWDKYTKKAVFARSDFSKEVLLVDNECVIPWEVLKNRGFLKIGIYGVTEDKVSPTLWSENIVVFEGVSESEESEEPTPSIYQQILNEVTETKTIAQSVRDDADNGKFNGRDGANGADGDDYILTDADKSEIIDGLNQKSEKWELINKTTLTRDSLVFFSEDMNQKPFELKKFKILVELPKLTNQIIVWLGCQSAIDSSKKPCFAQSDPITVYNNASVETTPSCYFSAEKDIVDGWRFTSIINIINGQSLGNVRETPRGHRYPNNSADLPEYMTNLIISASASLINTLPTGTTVKLWGVRV